MNKTNNTVFLIISVLVVSALFLAACTPVNTSQSSTDIKKFSSNAEIKQYLAQQAAEQTNYYSGGAYSRIFAEGSSTVMMNAKLSSAAPSADMSSTGGSASSSTYSTTNIQVQGVDEADIVKNDNKYIYTLSGNKLIIVDAYPAENAKILSQTKISGNAQDMLLNKDRLVVFTNSYDYVLRIQEYGFMPEQQYQSITYALVYELSDRANPKLVQNYSITGNYYESRMIEDYVYLITQEGTRYYASGVGVPVIKNSGKMIAQPDVYYFDNPESNYNFNTVASFNIQSNAESINAKTYLMGYSNTLYVSENNIFIAYQKNLAYNYYTKNNEERFYTAVLPLLPTETQGLITQVKQDSTLSAAAKWDKISSILEDMYNSMDETTKKDLIQKIEKSTEEYDIKQEQERRKTVIHKIKINNGNIDYDTKGEVSGYLLNQFSLDEKDNNLRVATTTYIYTQTSTMYNNVYVLDSNLKQIGKLEDIAPDEKIYSTRFIGNRLYMVTFKQMDPLFVIDLSEPTAPKILGELKIPGFSNYLHPYDETHIIGVGKETGTNDWGGVSTKGVKLALFDVTDVANPKEVAKYEIGTSGSDSEALNDHKAFLFDKEKNLLVIPVREVKGQRVYDSKYGYYKWNTWQGAYVFGLTPETGFVVKGRVTHTEDQEPDYWYYGSSNAVRRALFMDDVLYTVSAKKIMANDLNNISNEISTVKLPYDEQEYKPMYY